MAAGCAETPRIPAAPVPAGPVFQYELKAQPGEPWSPCQRPGEPARCTEMLVLAKRSGDALLTQEPRCCWECASQLNVCGSEHWPGRVLALGTHVFPPGGRCEPLEPADFEGDGELALQLYVHWLARTFGPPYLKDPAEVELTVPASAPRPTEVGITAGEVSCSDDDDSPAFRITLFRPALEGRPRQTLYGALAHEFHHVVQIRRDGLACKPTPENRERLEREADIFARRLVPPCQ
jgi:hypothetical protein